MFYIDFYFNDKTAKHITTENETWYDMSDIRTRINQMKLNRNKNN